MLESPEDEIGRRNMRTLKIPFSNFIYYFWGFSLFKYKRRRRRRRRVKRQFAFKKGEKKLNMTFSYKNTGFAEAK